MDDKNKIDSAIDQIIESKRLRQSVGGFVKIIKILVVLATITLFFEIITQ
jgi:hypothetical protein